MQHAVSHRRNGRILIATLLLGLFSINVNALDLAEKPLHLSGVSSTVDPNVMLLIDNSRSMTNIMWEDGYDPDTTYQDWDAGDTPTDGVFTATKINLGYTITTPLPANGASVQYDNNYINYLFDLAFVTLDPTTNLPFSSGPTADLTGKIPDKTRMQAAKSVSTTLVTDTANADMRFGTYTFNNGDGGTLVSGCGSDTATLTAGISNLTASGSTPLAETFHDITKYFRGANSPIQYRCQQNFVIVVTDGFPNADGTFSSESALPFLPQDPAPSFPNWDGVNNDGSGSKSEFLDDLAKFGYDIDLKPDPDGDKLDEDLDANGIGHSFDEAPYAQQNLMTHTIGFAFTNTMLDDAAKYGHGIFNSTASESGLSDALNEALRSIKTSGELKSVSSVAVNSGYLSDDTRMYMTSYANTGNDWTGDITTYKVVDNVATLDTDANAFTVPADYSTRKIFSFNGTSAAVPFVPGDSGLDTAAKNLLCPSLMLDSDGTTFIANPDCTSAKVGELMDYLAGADRAEQKNTNGTFRNRSNNLGDIINSAPAFVAPPSFRYPDTMTDTDGSLYNEAYSAFKIRTAERDKLLVVGANDGMLHAFNTTTGSEVMAYVPRMILKKLKSLSEPTYTHSYFVDGSATIGDAYYGTSWHTVLVSGMNKGAQGVFGLDITKTKGMLASDIKPWEFTDANHRDMGYSYSRPAIVLMANGRWAAVFGNGYNNSEDDTATGGKQGSGHAVLYIAYLGTGENGFTYSNISPANNEFVVLDTGAGTDNGLSTVTPVDTNGDFVIDAIYGGDLDGTMWKFNVSSTDSSKWSSSKLYSTCPLAPCEQAITTRPEVGRGPMSNSLMVYFGTGKYLEDSDPANKDLQSFYAVLDESVNSTTTVLSTQLVEQTIEQQGTTLEYTDPNDSSKKISLTTKDAMRVTSNNIVSYGATSGTNKGWYLDLSFDNKPLGERVITNPVLRNGRIIVTTNYYSATGTPKPSGSVCSADSMKVSGEGWIMQLDALHGGHLAYSPFDINGDGYINSDDNTLIASGIKFGENIATPTIIANGNKEIIITSGSKDDTQTTIGNAGPGSDGIQGWTQL